MRFPTRATKAAPFSTSRAGVRWVAAFSVVSRMKRPGIPCASPASVAIRAAAISACGLTRSYGRQSQPGKVITGISGAKNASAACIAANRLSSRATWITGPPEVSISDSTSRASKPSGAPPTVIFWGLDMSAVR